MSNLLLESNSADVDDLLAIMSDEGEGGEEFNFSDFDDNVDESFATCKQDQTMNKTATTVNDTFVSATSQLNNTQWEDAVDDFDQDGEDDEKTPSPGHSGADGSDGPTNTTLTEQEIEEQLQDAMSRRSVAIKEARQLLGCSSKATPPEDRSKKASGATVKLVPLDFSGAGNSGADEDGLNGSRENVRRQLAMDSDSEDDDEEMMDRKELNDSGRHIKKVMETRETLYSKSLPPSKPLPSSSQSNRPPVLTGVSDSKSSKAADRAACSAAVPVAAFNPFFGIKIRNPKVSSIAFDTVTEGMKKMRVSAIRSTMEEKDNWVTMAVIVERGEPKKSANGHDFMIWKVHDLKNCQDASVKVLLFGECCKEHWKIQAGAAVALVTPQLADQQQPTATTGGGKGGRGYSDKNVVTLKVARKAQVMELGYCSSYGICKGVRNDGQKCSNFVNLDLSDYCVFHVMNEARKLSSKRGVFSSVSSVPVTKRPPPVPRQPQGLMSVSRPALPVVNTVLNASGTMKAAGGTALKESTLKTTTKEEERQKLGAMLSSRAHMFGARNLVHLAATKEERVARAADEKSSARFTSMGDFMKERVADEKRADVVRAPTLGFGLRGGGEVNLTGGSPVMRSKQAANEAARLRAVAIIKKRREAETSASGGSGGVPVQQKGLKRANTDEKAPTPSKRSQLGSIDNKEMLAELLKRKSINDNLADKEELSAANKYLDGMERKERVETFLTDTLSMKNVKVVTCKKCGYTAQKQSELCMQSGHAVSWSTAEKRFFKCNSCNKRTVAFGLLPTKPCSTCEASDWERVGMKDERRVTLENERLHLRGEERKHVNM